MHKYFQKAIYHVRENTKHESLESSWSITKFKWHSLVSKSAKGSSESGFLLVLKIYSNLIVP